ncbi:MAG: hypothetical protein ACP5OR_05960 [Candidatus Dormibacteria bacterium]
MATVVCILATAQYVGAYVTVGAWTLTSPQNVSTSASDTLNAVDCTSSTSCTAVGFNCQGTGTCGGSYDNSYEGTLVETWNGSSWSTATTPNKTTTGNNRLLAVSCFGSTCMAVGSYSTGAIDQTLALTTSGSVWSISIPANTSTTQGNVLTGVSCVSATACMAVGHADVGGVYEPITEKWDGASWALLSSASPSTANVMLSGVSCTSTTFCMAVGSSQNATNPAITNTLAATWNGAGWSFVSTPDGSATASNELTGVSCPTAGYCQSVGDYRSTSAWQPLSLVWNGSSWALGTILSPSSTIDTLMRSISCLGTGFCVAIGIEGSEYAAGNAAFCQTSCLSGAPTSSQVEQTMAETWNGTAWSNTTIPNASTTIPNLLNSVSCTSTPTTVCMTVGSTLTVGSSTTGAMTPLVNPAMPGELAIGQYNANSAGGGTSGLTNGFTALSTSGNYINGMGYKVLNTTLPVYSEWLSPGNNTTTQLALFTPSSATTPISFIQQVSVSYDSTSSSYNTASNTMTVALPANVTAGDTVILLVGMGNNSTPVTGITGDGVTWQEAVSYNDYLYAGGVDGPTEIWYGTASSGGSNTATITFGGSIGTGPYDQLNISEYSGIAGLDQASTDYITNNTVRQTLAEVLSMPNVGSLQATQNITAGTLSFVVSPAAVTFSTITLNGFDQTSTATQVLDIGDNSGSGSGWNVTLSNTTFTSGSDYLASTDFTAATPSPPVCDTNSSCQAAVWTGSVPNPYVLPGSSSPATKLLSAEAGTGMGNQTATISWTAAIPSNVYTGTYSSTWTVSLVSGP